jgi:hypothetical protein
VITTPQARLNDTADGSDPPGTAGQRMNPDICPHGCVAAARTVTAEQVDKAVAQLRERAGRSAAEQVQSVIRAFDLTVVPPVVIPDPR